MVQAVLFGLTTLKLLVARFDVLDVDHMPYFPLFSARIVCALRRKRWWLPGTRCGERNTGGGIWAR